MINPNLDLNPNQTPPYFTPYCALLIERPEPPKVKTAGKGSGLETLTQTSHLPTSHPTTLY